MGEVDGFLANFQILGPLGCQGWVVLPENVKKNPIFCTFTLGRGVGVGEVREKVEGQQFTRWGWVENTNMTDCISSL
jgi:hypothetical protein